MSDPNTPELPFFATARDAYAPENAGKKADGGDGIGDPFGKYIVYVDESGDHGMQSLDVQYPVFVLAFCVFHKRHYSERVVPALETFKFKHFGHDQIVLHEQEIRKAGSTSGRTTKAWDSKFIRPKKAKGLDETHRGTGADRVLPIHLLDQYPRSMTLGN